MRLIRYAFLGLIILILVTLALANRELVELRVIPEAMGNGFGLGEFKRELPLFLVILLGVLIGLILGFIWEFLREHKHRAALVAREHEVKQLKRDIDQMKEEQGEEVDEILNLLEDK